MATEPPKRKSEVLNLTGIYPGKKHFIFGEPRELITEVFVEEKYLKYQQMVNSDPAQFEFLWAREPMLKSQRCKSWSSWPRFMRLTQVLSHSSMRRLCKMKKRGPVPEFQPGQSLPPWPLPVFTPSLAASPTLREVRDSFLRHCFCMQCS